MVNNSGETRRIHLIRLLHHLSMLSRSVQSVSLRDTIKQVIRYVWINKSVQNKWGFSLVECGVSILQGEKILEIGLPIMWVHLMLLNCMLKMAEIVKFCYVYFLTIKIEINFFNMGLKRRPGVADNQRRWSLSWAQKYRWDGTTAGSAVAWTSLFLSTPTRQVLLLPAVWF